MVSRNPDWVRIRVLCFSGRPQERVDDISSVTTDCIGAAISPTCFRGNLIYIIQVHVQIISQGRR